MTVDRQPFCSPECKANNGWRVDPDTLLPAERCPCRYRDVSPTEARDRGVTAAADGNEQAFRAALAIIRDAAKTHPELSANTIRTELRIAQIPGPVIGAAFRQAVKDRALVPVSYEPSTDAATHAHPIRVYESRIYRAGRAS